MECTLYKNGSTEKGLVTVTLEKRGIIVLIKEVPAKVCTNWSLLSIQ
ncbi:YgiT-type zinc finger protein [Algoriphagus antarcticus]|nr:YgiT-type zinc finger protein [Algoriphagus antarcticus]